MLSTHPRRPKLADTVVKQFLEKFRGREFVAGQRLPPEQELSELFGVSRGTLRAATQDLARLGYLEIRQGHGTFVTTPHLDVLLPPFLTVLADEPPVAGGLLQFRRLLEPEVARLAAEKCTARDATVLEELIQRQQTAAERGSRLIREDIALHHEIAKIAGNLLVLKILEVLHGLLEELRYHGSAEETLRQHGEIVEAIVQNDGELARRAMTAHLDWVVNVAKCKGLLWS